MKACFLVQNLYTLGGVQRVVITTVNLLAKKYGWKIDILMPGSDSSRISPLEESINVYDINSILGEKRIGVIGRILFALNRRIRILDFFRLSDLIEKLILPRNQEQSLIGFLKDRDYDVVVGVADNYTLILSIIADKLKAKTFGWEHSTYDAYYKTPGYASCGTDCVIRKNGQKLNNIFVLTHKDADKYIRNANAHASVLCNPLTINKRLERMERNKNVLFVGRLNKRVKGLDYLVRIIEKTVQLDSDIVFWIIGDGKDRDYLHKMVRRKRLDKNVVMEGYQSDVQKYYMQASLLISTSRWEGFGMSIVEAMANGIPVISFQNDGPDEIIKPMSTGYLIEKYKVDEFSQRIVEILNDETMWKKMSYSATAEALRYREDIIVTNMMSIIEGHDENYE